MERVWTGVQGKECIGILNRIVREGITVREVRKRYVAIRGEMFSAKGTAAIRGDRNCRVRGAAGRPVADMQ